MKTSGTVRRFGVAAAVALAFGSFLTAPANAADLVKFSNGEVITDSDFTGYVFRRTDLRSAARNKWGAEKVLREMAMTRALMHEGEHFKCLAPAKGRLNVLTTFMPTLFTTG
jgi:hypothetical protein